MLCCGSMERRKIGQLLGMIRRNKTAEEPDATILLREAPRAGVAAMADPVIEARVVEYFLKNPNFSRDAVHVAAVACQFRDEVASPRKSVSRGV